MAKIKKIKEGTATVYPATIPQAVIDPTSGKSVRTELNEKEAVANKKQTVTNSATDYPSGAGVTASLALKTDISEINKIYPLYNYNVRVGLDSGLIKDLSYLTDLYRQNLSLLDSTVFLWNGEAGTKRRISGSNTFASKLYNMANKVQQFGSNIVTNGTFDTDSSWSKEAGWSIDTVNKVAVASSVTSSFALYQSKTYENNVTYHVQLTIKSYSSGTLLFAPIQPSGAYYSFPKAAGTYIISFIGNGLPGQARLYSTDGFTGTVDDFIIRRMDWVEGTNDAAQSTEANQPYVCGLIAPNEVGKIKNLVDNKIIPLQTPLVLSSTGNSSFSITTVLKPYFMVIGTGSNKGKISKGLEIFYNNNGSIALYNAGTGTLATSGFDGRKTQGNTIVTMVFSPSGIQFIINGVPYGYAGTYTPFTATFLGLLDDGSDDAFAGEISHFQIFNRAISASEIQAQHEYLRLQIPEIEGIAIGNQYWQTSNYEGVVAGDGSVIQEIQDSNNTHIIPEALNLLDGWTALGGAVINDANTFTASSSLTGASRGVSAFLKIGESVKITLNLTTTATRVVVGDSYGSVGSFVEFTPVGGVVNETKYLKWTGSGVNNLTLYIRLQEAGSTVDITTFTVEKVGWSQSTALYDAIYAQTSGTAAQKELAALKAAAMWKYPNNDVSIGAITGKIYNGYATLLINKYPPIGYRVGSYNDQLQLSNYLGGNSVAGAKLKALYGAFNNSYSTNESGFSAIPAGYISAQGVYSSASNSFISNCDGVNVGYMSLLNSMIAIQTLVNIDFKSQGFSIRLLRNSPVGANERTITSTTIVSDIASTANSTQIPFGYSVASIRLKTTANLTNIKVELWNNFYSGTPTLVATLITGKTANNTTMVFPVLADCPSLLQDGTLRITATGANTFETIVEYNLQKNTF